MKKKWFFILIFSNLLALGLLAGLTRPVSAKYSAPKTPPPPKPTVITLDDPGAKKLGENFVLTGKLTLAGQPVVGKSIIVTLDGKLLGMSRTDQKGEYALKVNQDMAAGDYQLAATFKGTRLMALSTTSVPLKILPADFNVQTVPPIAGVSFMMDGRQFVTDQNGMAVISINKGGTYQLTVEANRYSNPNQKIEFARWLDEYYLPYRDIQIPQKGTITVGLNVYYRVNQTFVDLDGRPVDPSRITGISIKSAQGDIFNYQQGQTLWVPASRIARRSSGLESTKLLYSVMRVTVDGSNVVIAAQQRFFTGTNETWKISLTLYSIQVAARDLLLGSPVGSAVVIKYPNGKVENHPLNEVGFVSIPSLARGIYQIQIAGTKGLDTTTPVALSRNQIVSENVITYLDLGIAGGFGLFIALGLLLFGRPWLLLTRKYRLKFKRYRMRESERVSIHDN